MEKWQIWGDLATWVTGIATIALFIIGFLQIRNERISRLKSEKVQEERQRRIQAELISSWIVKKSRDLICIAVFNNSQQPIYQIIVSEVRIGQTGDSIGVIPEGGQVHITIAPPGLGYIKIPYFAPGMHHQLGVEVAFKDVAGRNWVRLPDGGLTQIEKSPLEYYDIAIPTDWIDLELSLPPDEIITPNNSSD
jgi:hypothetical protein